MVLEGYADWLRMIMGLLGIVDFILVVARLWGFWQRLVNAQRILFAALLCFMTTSVWASFEYIYTDFPMTYRTPIQFLGLCLMFVYLTEPTKFWKDRVLRYMLSGENFRRRH